MTKEVTKEMVDALVNPEHQYKESIDPPLDSVRMAWPFKTEEELEVIRKWFNKQKAAQKQKEVEQVTTVFGVAFL